MSYINVIFIFGSVPSLGRSVGLSSGELAYSRSTHANTRTQSAYLVLFGHFTVGADKDPDDSGVSVSRRRVDRSIPVLKQRTKRLGTEF